MYNLKKIKAQLATEKYLRKDNVGPKANDDQPITEKVLEGRKGSADKTIESELNESRSSEKDAQVLEKVLNDTKEWRTAEDGLLVPPINTIVAKLEEERRGSFKAEKESHWSQNLGDKKQQGSLPAWKKNAPQHDKMVLNNDPDRFNGKEVEELIGGLRIADVDRAVMAIKTGETLEYDAAIIAILKEADADRRELTSVERKAISDLKISRTRSILQVK